MAEESDVTFAVTDEHGDESTLTLPRGIVDALSEPDDDPADVVVDIALMGFVQRAHAVVHHSEGEVGDDLEAAEERALELFEERFGVSYAEATGHDH